MTSAFRTSEPNQAKVRRPSARAGENPFAECPFPMPQVAERGRVDYEAEPFDNESRHLPMNVPVDRAQGFVGFGVPLGSGAGTGAAAAGGVRVWPHPTIRAAEGDAPRPKQAEDGQQQESAPPPDLDAAGPPARGGVQDRLPPKAKPLRKRGKPVVDEGKGDSEKESGTRKRPGDRCIFLPMSREAWPRLQPPRQMPKGYVGARPEHEVPVPCDQAGLPLNPDELMMVATMEDDEKWVNVPLAIIKENWARRGTPERPFHPLDLRTAERISKKKGGKKVGGNQTDQFFYFAPLGKWVSYNQHRAIPEIFYQGRVSNELKAWVFQIWGVNLKPEEGDVNSTLANRENLALFECLMRERGWGPGDVMFESWLLQVLVGDVTNRRAVERRLQKSADAMEETLARLAQSLHDISMQCDATTLGRKHLTACAIQGMDMRGREPKFRQVLGFLGETPNLRDTGRAGAEVIMAVMQKMGIKGVMCYNSDSASNEQVAGDMVMRWQNQKKEAVFEEGQSGGPDLDDARIQATLRQMMGNPLTPRGFLINELVIETANALPRTMYCLAHLFNLVMQKTFEGWSFLQPVRCYAAATHRVLALNNTIKFGDQTNIVRYAEAETEKQAVAAAKKELEEILRKGLPLPSADEVVGRVRELMDVIRPREAARCYEEYKAWSKEVLESRDPDQIMKLLLEGGHDEWADALVSCGALADTDKQTDARLGHLQGVAIQNLHRWWGVVLHLESLRKTRPWVECACAMCPGDMVELAWGAHKAEYDTRVADLANRRAELEKDIAALEAKDAAAKAKPGKKNPPLNDAEKLRLQLDHKHLRELEAEPQPVHETKAEFQARFRAAYTWGPLVQRQARLTEGDVLVTGRVPGPQIEVDEEAQAAADLRNLRRNARQRDRARGGDNWLGREAHREAADADSPPARDPEPEQELEVIIGAGQGAAAGSQGAGEGGGEDGEGHPDGEAASPPPVSGAASDDESSSGNVEDEVAETAEKIRLSSSESSPPATQPASQRPEPAPPEDELDANGIPRWMAPCLDGRVGPDELEPPITPALFGGRSPAELDEAATGQIVAEHFASGGGETVPGGDEAEVPAPIPPLAVYDANTPLDQITPLVLERVQREDVPDDVEDAPDFAWLPLRVDDPRDIVACLSSRIWPVLDAALDVLQGPMTVVLETQKFEAYQIRHYLYWCVTVRKSLESGMPNVDLRRGCAAGLRKLQKLRERYHDHFCVAAGAAIFDPAGYVPPVEGAPDNADRWVREAAHGFLDRFVPQLDKMS